MLSSYIYIYMVNALPFLPCCEVFACVVSVCLLLLFLFCFCFVSVSLLLFVVFVSHFTSDNFTSLRLTSNHFKARKRGHLFSISD